MEVLIKSVALLLLIAVGTSFTFAQDVRTVIEQNNQKMEQAMMNDDYNSMMTMYADDVISLPSYEPMLRGKNEVQQAVNKHKESGMKVSQCEFNTVEVREEGNVAIEVGTYNMTMVNKESNQEWTDTGKYLTVWEKAGNDWKIAMETWNSDKNPWQEMKQDDQQKKDQGME